MVAILREQDAGAVLKMAFMDCVHAHKSAIASRKGTQSSFCSCYLQHAGGISKSLLHKDYMSSNTYLTTVNLI
jgi:hypothetical protein